MQSHAGLVEEFGYPLYLYEEEVIAARLALLRQTLPDFSLLYSIKANPCPAICAFMARNGVGADAASLAEVTLSQKSGMDADKIYYSAPGKSQSDLRAAMGQCALIADSYGELERLNALAKEKGWSAARPLPVGLRVNPDIAFGPGPYPELLSGRSGKFGVDEESLVSHMERLRQMRNIRLAGLHVFLRSQVLRHEVIAASFAHVFSLAQHCKEQLGWNVEYINFGGGLGIGSALDAQGGGELDMAALGTLVGETVSKYGSAFSGTRLLLESGRFLTGQAGTFITRIEDVKESRGKTYVIAPGCLNGFLRPAVMGLLDGLEPKPQGPLEPLFSGYGAHRVSLPGKSGKDNALVEVTVCGGLCTAFDTIARDVALPDPRPGDVLAISNAGAYAATLSPFAFASFERPKELYRKADGTILV